MRYSILALKFIGKNFLYLLTLTAVSAVFLSWCYSNTFSFSMLLNRIFFGFKEQDKFNFTNIYFSFSLFSDMNWYLAIPALIIIFLMVSLVFAYANRTMKVGAKSLRMPFLRLNETIVPVFLVAIILLALFQLFALFAALIVNLLLTTGNPPLYITLIPVLITALYTIFFLIFLLLFMCIPTMLVTGYKFRESVSYSVKLSKRRILKFGLACLTPLVLIVLINSFLPNFIWLRMLTGSVFTSFLLMYFPTLMMTTYYDIEGIKRNDVKRRPVYY